MVLQAIARVHWSNQEGLEAYWLMHCRFIFHMINMILSKLSLSGFFLPFVLELYSRVGTNANIPIWCSTPC